MLSSKLRRVVRLQGILIFIFTSILTLFITELPADWIRERIARLWPYLVGILAVSGVGVLICALRKPPGLDMVIKFPLPIDTEEEARRNARRGFVGFLPLYSPPKGSVAEGLSREERERAIERLDFDVFDLEDSNFCPTITAILTHRSDLQHCWLIATKGGQRTEGSAAYAPLLVEYLKRERGLECTFHYHDGTEEGARHTIAVDRDEVVINRAYQEVLEIFREAEREGIPSREMVADITTGMRNMALGMTLACLRMDRDVEIVGSHYDEEGHPTGELFPTIYQFGTKG